MSPETAHKLTWFGKLFQLMAAIILTPEIIGPDRFERLEKFIESKELSENPSCIYALSLLLLYIVIGGLSSLFFVGGQDFLKGILSKVQVGLVLLLALVLYAVIYYSMMDKILDFSYRLVWNILVKITAYLRRVSLFRTVAIATAIGLFFFGVGVELVLEWPFLK